MLAIVVTAYIALTCWAMANWAPRVQAPRWSRLFWTLACLANLGHVLLAFHVVHAWDYNAATVAIAEQSYEQTGIAWDGGIYVNFAFCALWLADAGTWWLAPVWYERRSRWLDGLIQFIVLFMFVNGTVVFGKTPLRWAGGVLCAAGASGWIKASWQKNAGQKNKKCHGPMP